MREYIDNDLHLHKLLPRALVEVIHSIERAIDGLGTLGSTDILSEILRVTRASRASCRCYRQRVYGKSSRYSWFYQSSWTPSKVSAISRVRSRLSKALWGISMLSDNTPDALRWTPMMSLASLELSSRYLSILQMPIAVVSKGSNSGQSYRKVRILGKDHSSMVQLTSSSVGNLESFLCLTPIVGCEFFVTSARDENSPPRWSGPRVARTFLEATFVSCSVIPRSSWVIESPTDGAKWLLLPWWVNSSISSWEPVLYLMCAWCALWTIYRGNVRISLEGKDKTEGFTAPA